MSEIKHESIDNIPQSHKNEHEGYEYYRRKFVSFGEAENTSVSVYEIPPKKAAYPYHFHHNNEETFYIISGEGILRTPSCQREHTVNLPSSTSVVRIHPLPPRSYFGFNIRVGSVFYLQKMVGHFGVFLFYLFNKSITLFDIALGFIKKVSALPRQAAVQ